MLCTQNILSTLKLQDQDERPAEIGLAMSSEELENIIMYMYEGRMRFPLTRRNELIDAINLVEFDERLTQVSILNWHLSKSLIKSFKTGKVKNFNNFLSHGNLLFLSIST